MRIGNVIGKLSLEKSHASLVGHRWLLAVPQSLAALAGENVPPPAEVVLIDEIGLTEGAVTGFSEGAEAAFAFYPERKPVDMYACCDIEELTLDHAEMRRLLAQ